MEDHSPNIIIRNATADDVPFVAGCVLASVDLYDFRSPSVETETAERVCSMDDTLYSFRNARLACVDGTPVGCLVSYDGAAYAAAREKTFRIFDEEGHPMTGTDMETGPGEWYFDSMSILPSFRGYGIGKVLMLDSIGIAKDSGASRIALIVEKSKPKLQEYYASLGFVPEREIQAFGDSYIRMTLTIDSHTKQP